MEVVGIEPLFDKVSLLRYLQEMKHRKYSEHIKESISKSKNPYLFPELNIPVSTAKYWIKTKQHLGRTATQESKHTITKKEFKRIKEENRELKRRIQLIKQVNKLLGFDLKNRHIKDLETKEQVISTIKSSLGRKSLTSALEDINMSKSRYKRWNKELKLHVCHPPQEYLQKHPRALTFNEFNTLCELYTSEKYFHYPLYALSIKARRENLINASPATWSKYARL